MGSASLLVDGLCPYPVSCLACDVPVLVPTGSWVDMRLGPEVNKLEGGFHNAGCQHQGPRGRINPPKMSAPSVCVPRVSSSYLLPLQEAF